MESGRGYNRKQLKGYQDAAQLDVTRRTGTFVTAGLSRLVPWPDENPVIREPRPRYLGGLRNSTMTTAAEQHFRVHEIDNGHA